MQIIRWSNQKGEETYIVLLMSSQTLLSTSLHTITLNKREVHHSTDEIHTAESSFPPSGTWKPRVWQCVKKTSEGKNSMIWW